MRKLFARLPPTFRQATSFAVVGGFSFIADLSFYAFLTRTLGVYYLVANVISFFTIGSVNFLANRHFTFRHRGRPQASQITKFFIVAGTGVVLNTSILALLVRTFGIHDLIAKGAAAGVVFFWNFGVNRFWTFRHPKDNLPVTPL